MEVELHIHLNINMQIGLNIILNILNKPYLVYQYPHSQHKHENRIKHNLKYTKQTISSLSISSFTQID